MRQPASEQIQAILYSLKGQPSLRHVTVPRRGMTASVFLLETDSGSLVLRTFDEAAAHWKPQKEKLVCRLLQEQGIPAPTILKTDNSHALVPFTYSLTEYLPDVTLSEAYDSLDISEKLSFYKQFGSLIGRMHTRTFEAFGDVADWEGRIVIGPAWEICEEDETADPGPFNTWASMHTQIVTARLNFLRQTEFADLADPLGHWFDRHASLIDYPITPRLLHMDLHMSNLLVSEGKITGVLDVGESVVGHNEYDLMRTELAHFGAGYEDLQTAFFQGYRSHITLNAGYEERKPLYELSRWLVGLQCFVQFSGKEDDKQAARERVVSLLATDT